MLGAPGYFMVALERDFIDPASGKAPQFDGIIHRVRDARPN